MQPGRGNAEPWLLILLLLMLLAASHGAQYKVGDDSGWQLGTDLSSWGSRNSYQPGDTLLFDTQGQHPVYQVTPADYQACNIGNPLEQHTGGTVVVTLGAAGTYCFICGIPGHCLAGMKLTIDVHASAVPPAASSPVKTPIAPASPPLPAALPPVPSSPLSPPPTIPTSNPPPPKSAPAPAPTPQEQLAPPPKSAPASLAPSPVPAPAPASLAPSPVPAPAPASLAPSLVPAPTLAATSPSTAPVQPPVEPLLPPDVAAPSIASSPALPGFDASATPSQAPVPASESSSNRVFLTPGIMLVAILLLWSSTL